MIDIEKTFSGVKVLVVGDVMLDRFWWGDVTRISPEAPVPVVRLDRTSLAPGGAANVAANIRGLGATPLLLGVTGTDPEGSALKSVVSELGISADHLLQIASRTTTVKTRILAHNQQVARVDNETRDPLSATEQEAVLDVFISLVNGVDALVISDYAKGCLTEDVLNEVIDTANELRIPIVVDPKGRDYTRYRGATILTPNRREAALACNIDDESNDLIETAGNRLLTDLDLSAALITEGEYGMTLFEHGETPLHLDASAREVYDSTGAGDTVIAALAVALAAGLQIREAAMIANAAAGLVVEKVGTATVDAPSVASVLEANSFRAVQ